MNSKANIVATQKRNLKLTLVAALAWMAFEAVLYLSHYEDLAAIDDTDGPNTGQSANLLLHWPGLISAQRLGLSGAAGFVVMEAVTLIQMVMIFWIARILWKRLTLADLNHASAQG